MTSDCYPCRMNDARPQPPRENAWSTQHWRVAHAFDTDLPGWLVVVPRTHVTSMAELSPAAADEFGGLLRLMSRALTQVTGAVKTYLMLFAEAEGFSHLHVHLVPRLPDQPAAEHGPAVFSRLGKPEDERLTEPQRDELCIRLRRACVDEARP